MKIPSLEATMVSSTQYAAIAKCSPATGAFAWGTASVKSFLLCDDITASRPETEEPRAANWQSNATRTTTIGRTNAPVSLCFAGGDDLQALMVSAGRAWAYTQLSGQNVDAERRAAARGVSVHAHHCQP